MIEALRARLSRLSKASLHINKSIDFDAVLRSVLYSACSPTGASYGLLTLLDDAGPDADFLSSDMIFEVVRRLWDSSAGFFSVFLSGKKVRCRSQTRAQELDPGPESGRAGPGRSLFYRLENVDTTLI